MPASLDKLDRKILRALQRNGRLSNAELARTVNASPTACWNRTRQLMTAGVITGFRARIDPAAVGRGVLVIVGVVLDRSTPESFRDFEAAVTRSPAVLSCHLVAGEVDYFVRVRVADIAAFNRLHAQFLLRLPGVRQIRTFFVLNDVKDDGEVEIPA